MDKTDQIYRLIWMSRPLMQAAEACVEAGLKGTGLTVRRRAVLEVLDAQGDATVPEIAHRLEIQRQYVQLMVNETHAEGLTVTRANPRHKSSPMIALSEKGRGLIATVIGRERQLVQELSAEIDPVAAAKALDLVVLLVEKLKAQTGAAAE